MKMIIYKCKSPKTSDRILILQRDLPPPISKKAGDPSAGSGQRFQEVKKMIMMT